MLVECWYECTDLAGFGSGQDMRGKYEEMEKELAMTRRRSKVTPTLKRETDAPAPARHTLTTHTLTTHTLTTRTLTAHCGGAPTLTP